MSKLSIRLHYIWFKDYFGFHDQGINLSTKYKFFYDSNKNSVNMSDIVNIALHILLKNFEQQFDGINIHEA